MFDFKPEDYPELVQAIQDDNLILFVGAGLSWDLENIQGEKLEGWDNLVKRILEFLQEEGYDSGPLIPLLGRFEPIKILGLLESDPTTNRGKVNLFLKEFFDLKDSNDFSIHKDLVQLSHKIITTNYDDAFEKTSRELEKNVAFKGKNYELTTHKNNRLPLLFKLHGCFKTSDSMVLFPSNYRNLYENDEKDAEHSLLVLKNIIQNKAILFLGCGMGDFQINSIFKEIGRLQGLYKQKHFIFSTSALDSSLDFLTRIPLNNHGEIPFAIKELLKKKKQLATDKSPEYQLIEKQLKKVKGELSEMKLKEKQFSDSKFLLKEESLKYLQEGLELLFAKDYTSAIPKFERAVKLDPKSDDGYMILGVSLGSLANTQFGEEQKETFEQAFEKYEKAIVIKPDKHEAYYNWGNSLGALAKTQSGEEQKETFEQAFEKYENAIVIKPDKHESYHNWGTFLVSLAKTQTGDEQKETFEQAFEKYEKAIGIKPEFHEAYYNWGSSLGDLAKTQSGEEQKENFEQAFEKYEKAIGIKPDKHEAYYNWGTFLVSLAKTQSGEEQKETFEQAFVKYEKAIVIKPEFHEAYYNWGTYLGDLAKIQSGEEQKETFEQAFEKYEKAIVIKPEFHDAYYNWGNSLGDLAKIQSGEEQKSTFKQAFEKYENAIVIKPDKHEAYNNWGNSLGALAKTQSGEEQKATFEQAFAKFENAIGIKPEFHEGYYNWGNSLGDLAKIQSGEEQKAIFEQAFEKLKLSYDLGGSCYNLACIYALRGEKDSAFLFLRKSLDENHIRPEFVLQDSDWVTFLNDLEFKSILERK